MTNSYTKTNVTAGDPGLATFANAIQTQADAIETDLAAGSLAVAASGLTGTINSARIPTRNASIFLSAGGGTPTATAGCAPAAKVELPTNDIMLVSLDYDPTTRENATFMFPMPDGWNGGTLVPVFYWTAASGSGGVVWGIEGRSVANDEAMDQAVGTAVEAADTLLSANDVHIVAGSALTLAGTPAAGELVILKVYRKPADASDTLGVDAKLIGVKLEYVSSYSD